MRTSKIPARFYECALTLYTKMFARVGVACEVVGIGVPQTCKSLSVHAYTMHTVPVFLQIDEHLFSGEIEQIAELTEIL